MESTNETKTSMTSVSTMSPICKTILDQIGGPRVAVMAGCGLMYGPKCLKLFNIRASRNFKDVDIAYHEGTDTYDITFVPMWTSRIRDFEHFQSRCKTIEGVYLDNLKSVIENTLKIYLTF